MRVLITGATGFVGYHAARALQASGHDLRLLVRDVGKLSRVFGEAAPEHVVGDIVDLQAVDEAMAGCDAVVHCAAVVAMEAARADEVLATNRRGVDNVIGGAVKAGLSSIVYASSVSAMFEPGGPPVTGDSPVKPGRSAYARSKAEAELRVRELQREGAPIHTVYPAAVVGPDDPGLSEANHGLRTFVRDLTLITSSGFQAVDVRDLAEVIARSVTLEGQGRWVAAGPYLSWREMADMLDTLTGRRVRRVRIPGALLRLGGYLFDAVRSFRQIDFPMTIEGMKFATQMTVADARATEEQLGVRFRPSFETYADALRWMYEAGHIPAEKVGKLAG